LLTSENDIQVAIFNFHLIMSECGIEISVRKIKAVAFRGEEPGRCKIVLDDKTGTGRKFELFGL
jgi:hypothetical protein